MGFVALKAAALLPQPQAAPSRRVECIGDSIMCGAHSERSSPFPADCKDEHQGNRESSHLSWCPVLARALQADCNYTINPPLLVISWAYPCV